MEQELVERYLYAVTRYMPRKKREDVTRELRGLIEDMLAERCGAVTPGEKDIRIVLLELGDPRELREKYDDSGKRCLIGQPYYRMYTLVLKLVLGCSVLGLTLASVIMQMMEPQVWYQALGNWLAMLWNGCMGAFTATTLLYAFFYHKGIRLEQPFNFDDLPPVPQKKQEISLWECVSGIGFIVVFWMLLLAAPQIFRIYYGATGEWIPVLNTETVRAGWYVIVLYGILGIVREAVKLMERRYNRRVMLVSCTTDLLSAVLSFWWLTGWELMDPEFTQRMATLFQGENAFIGKILGNFQYFFLGIILFALILDAATALWKCFSDKA